MHHAAARAKETADPGVRGVEPAAAAAVRGAAHDAVLRVGDAGRARRQGGPLLLPPRRHRRRRGGALQQVAVRLAASAQAGQEGTCANAPRELTISVPVARPWHV